jgi:heme/copper-type cytochrome/quinol oxidase subunit 2
MFLSVFPRVGASERNAAGNERKAKRLGPALLLALPFLVALIPEAVDSTQTINITVSRYGLSPERIELQADERIRLNVLALDGTPGCHVKGLGLNAAIPSGARSVTVELAPKEVGTFEISCSKCCGRGHGPTTALLIVLPRA